MPAYELDPVSAIVENSAKEYQLTINGKSVEIFVVRKHGRYYAYANHCPHTGVNLNWQANQFFDFQNHYLQCSTHGALFRVEDGFCVRGPCAGASLQSINLDVNNDTIRIHID